MNIDTAHTLLASVSLAAIAVGASVAWGLGYGLMMVGGIVLAGVIYTRTRT